jgi:hypothetical protein
VTTHVSAAFAFSLALHEETSVRAVARRAYQIWEREGRPQGRDIQHWLEAESEIARDLAIAIANAPGAPRLIADRTFTSPRGQGSSPVSKPQS